MPKKKKDNHYSRWEKKAGIGFGVETKRMEFSRQAQRSSIGEYFFGIGIPRKKKGSVLDLIFMVVLCMIFAIIVLFGTHIWNQIAPLLKNTFGPGDATDIMNSVQAQFGVMDYVFLFLFFGMCIIPIILAFLVKLHPIFFVVNILLLIVMFIVMPPLSNTVRSIWQTKELSQYAAGGGGFVTYPIMTKVFQYLPIITGALSIVLSIAMFVKAREI